MEPIIQATYEEDIFAVREQLAAGVDINYTDHTGWTPLMYACCSENPMFVRQLIKLGADPWIQSPNGGTAASIAERNGCHDVAKLLLATWDDYH